MASLLYVKPNEIKKHIDYVRKGVTIINSKCNDRWTIEDLYLLLKTEKAALYLVMNPDVDGFVVLQLNDDFDGYKNVNVFAAYSDTKDIMSYALPLVKTLASEIGAKRLTFVSPREGWHKSALALGYKQVSINYEMEL